MSEIIFYGPMRRCRMDGWRSSVCFSLFGRLPSNAPAGTVKVLFLTNGLGLGNSTRCHAIMQRLHAKGVHIEVVTSGNGLWYFSDKSEVSAIHEIQSLTYGSKDGAISISRTFGSIFRMLAIFRSNAKPSVKFSMTFALMSS